MTLIVVETLIISDIKNEIAKNSMQINSLIDDVNNINDNIEDINIILNGKPNKDGLCTRLAVLEKLMYLNQNKNFNFELKWAGY